MKTSPLRGPNDILSYYSPVYAENFFIVAEFSEEGVHIPLLIQPYRYVGDRSMGFEIDPSVERETEQSKRRARRRNDGEERRVLGACYPYADDVTVAGFLRPFGGKYAFFVFLLKVRAVGSVNGDAPSP